METLLYGRTLWYFIFFTMIFSSMPLHLWTLTFKYFQCLAEKSTLLSCLRLEALNSCSYKDGHITKFITFIKMVLQLDGIVCAVMLLLQWIKGNTGSLCYQHNHSVQLRYFICKKGLMSRSLCSIRLMTFWHKVQTDKDFFLSGL